MLQLMHEGCSYTYPLLSIAKYSFIQLSELEQCRVKTLAEGFHTAAKDSNPGARSREFETIPLSHCALQLATQYYIYFILALMYSSQRTHERVIYIKIKYACNVNFKPL